MTEKGIHLTPPPPPPPFFFLRVWPSKHDMSRKSMEIYFVKNYIKMKNRTNQYITWHFWHIGLYMVNGAIPLALWWRHNGHDSVSNHQPHHCLLNRLFGCRSKKTSKLCVTGLCAGNSPGPVNSPHKWPVTRKLFPFDDVIMVSTINRIHCMICSSYNIEAETK